MAEYEPLEIRGFYRSHSHLPIWEVMDKAGSWEKVGLKVSFEFCDSSSAAEKALFEQAGLHVLSLDRLPMINGPTLTSTLTTLQKKDRLGERLVKAQVMGIHFARTRRGETEKILEGLRQRVPECKNVNYRNVAKLLPKPYPDHEGVANAYRLCCMKDPETEEQSPMALWDLHYLRELDDSGFIDEIYK